MKIVIQTQIRENYGDADKPYWKFKGGNTYLVLGLTPGQIEVVTERGIPTLTKLIESRNPMFEEYVLGFNVVEDNVVSHDPWEAPFSLAWEGGRWLARRTIENNEYGYMRQEIEAKTEQYDMLMGGERANYTCSFVMRDGREFTYEQLEQFYKEAA